MTNPPISVLVYSPFGGGKTHFLGTFPKPMLVFFFDRYGKDLPLLKLGQASQLMQLQVGTTYIPCKEIRDPQTNELLVRLEYYHDVTEPPTAYSTFLNQRMATIHLEFEQWATIAIDSMTFLEFSARKWDELVLNAGHRDPRSHYAQSMNMLETLLYSRLAGFPMNVVVTAHVDRKMSEIHGEILHTVAAPGSLKGRIGAAFQEVYRIQRQKNEDGTFRRILQTQEDGEYQAQTQLEIPMYVEPTYEALFWSYK